jgi:hypothetical protein
MPDNKMLDVSKLEEALGGDTDLVLFFLTWLKHNRNATKAYQELHPEADYGSARTLGSRVLAKVDKKAVLDAYDLGNESYFQQLYEGLHAERRDQFSGEMYPDHKTREPYHTKLGKLLDIEKEKPSDTVIPIINIQINENGVVEKGGKE